MLIELSVQSSRKIQKALMNFIIKIKFADTAGENWRSLLRIIKLCEIYNVNISLFIAPYISYNNFTNEIDLIRSNIGEDVNFYDFSNSLNDHTQFADPIHINTKGKNILSEKFLHILKTKASPH